jgi:hypothetical protein
MTLGLAHEVAVMVAGHELGRFGVPGFLTFLGLDDFGLSPWPVRVALPASRLPVRGR